MGTRVLTRGKHSSSPWICSGIRAEPARMQFDARSEPGAQQGQQALPDPGRREVSVRWAGAAVKSAEDVQIARAGITALASRGGGDWRPLRYNWMVYPNPPRPAIGSLISDGNPHGFSHGPTPSALSL